MLQSTSPARGKTPKHTQGNCPLGASIHFPREGEDDTILVSLGVEIVLQSTSPARGKTSSGLSNIAQENASIHFPREGEDLSTISFLFAVSRFNPLPPRGGRHSEWGGKPAVFMLQSTSPARGKTNFIRFLRR